MNIIREKGLEALQQEQRQGKKNRGVDLLSKFHQAQHDHPDFMTDKQVLSSANSNIIAGSETTG